jgi:DNA-directed RNA polymerase subunit H (RpoH/RPB5)
MVRIVIKQKNGNMQSVLDVFTQQHSLTVVASNMDADAATFFAEHHAEQEHEAARVLAVAKALAEAESKVRMDLVDTNNDDDDEDDNHNDDDDDDDDDDDEYDENEEDEILRSIGACSDDDDGNGNCDASQDEEEEEEEEAVTDDDARLRGSKKSSPKRKKKTKKKKKARKRKSTKKAAKTKKKSTKKKKKKKKKPVRKQRFWYNLLGTASDVTATIMTRDLANPSPYTIVYSVPMAEAAGDTTVGKQDMLSMLDVFLRLEGVIEKVYAFAALTSQGKVVASSHPNLMTVLSVSTFAFDKTMSNLVSRYHVLTAAEVAMVLKKHKITVQQLPTMLATDAIRQYYLFKAGDVVEAIDNKTIRLCV